ncbi:MAG: DUF3419 family protein [Paracoccaceae bacterium]|nr:DUF3419 family protein [Paracoccaceae bacterium]
MTEADIARRAQFDIIRYAQLWEDADVLTAAMGEVAGGTLVSICSAGDNALSLLTLDPARVVVVDLSPAQLACLHLRIGAFGTLEHQEFLALMGARPAPNRASLLERAVAPLDEPTRAFWMSHVADVVAHGAGGIGKFERYFRLFRKVVLPLAHNRATVDAIFVPRPIDMRRTFLETRFETWRWTLLLKLFFSRFVMGRMGRDKAFFDHVEGSVSEHVARRIRHAAIDLDPAENPFLHWIMKGDHGTALPMAWREEHFQTIRDRLDRLDIRLGALEALAETGEKADGYNLSDIFEYMPPEVAAGVYESLLDASNAGARLVYWNMMAPRRVPAHLRSRVRTLSALEDQLNARDKAFFYSDFVIEEVIG